MLYVACISSSSPGCMVSLCTVYVTPNGRLRIYLLCLYEVLTHKERMHREFVQLKHMYACLIEFPQVTPNQIYEYHYQQHSTRYHSHDSLYSLQKPKPI